MALPEIDWMQAKKKKSANFLSAIPPSLAIMAILPQLPCKPAKTPAPEGYRYELSGPEGWMDTGVPGFRTKLLSRFYG
jgi:hypothetical protein